MMRFMFPVIIATILSLPVSGQSPAPRSLVRLERQLNAELHDKGITLRKFSKSDHQHFDEDGQLKKQSDTGPWTIYSQILVKKVELSESRLRIAGVRIIHHHDANLRKLVASPSDMNVDIDIDMKKDPTAADISAVLKNMVVGPEGLLPLVPNYWRSYLGEKKEEKAASDGSDPKRVRVGGNVIAANLIKQVRPKYAEVAKSFLLQGLVVLEAEIGETGDVEKISIIQPAGAGFDESAVEAVSQWKYKPSTLNGKPVRVVTTITVNYEFAR